MSRDYWDSQSQYPPPHQSRVFNNQPPAPQPPVAHDSLHQAHRLLATYPFASATPITHPTRHLSNLSLSAAPPSYYIQPSSYYPQVPSYQQQYPLQYHQYANEVSHLNSSTQSPHADPIWDSARSNAVRFLGSQTPNISYYEPQQWQQDFSPPTFQPTPFANTVLQHTAPAALYPTPPPPGITSSSSSLAMALGEPTSQNTRKVYRPNESQAFFNNFLAQQAKTQEIPRTPRRPITVTKEENSDALPLTPSSSHTEPTPKKRKADVTFETPSVKRKQTSGDRPLPAPIAKPPVQQTNGIAGLPPKPKFEVFVEIPSSSKSHRAFSHSSGHNASQLSMQQKRSYRDGHDPDADTGYSSQSRSPAKRGMGDRDERGPLDKFVTLMEDIFEAEDQLPPDAESSDLPLEFFSHSSVDYSRPLLHPNIVKKLTAYIGKVARPTKRVRLSSKEHSMKHPGTPRSKGRMSEVDTTDISRLLRMLERSLKVAEDLDPFRSMGSTSELSSGSTAKKPGKLTKTVDRKRSKSKTPKPGDDAGSGDEAMAEGPTSTDIDSLASALVAARDAVLAAECCIALLGSDRLTKQLYSEELIMSCLVSVKTHLTQIVYPFVEASLDLYGRASPLLKFAIRAQDGAGHRRQLAEVFHSISSVIPRINDLICSDYISLSESIIIQAVYIAVGPFFMVDPADGRDRDKKDNVILGTLGNSAIRGLRLDALSLIRSIFANHEDQRSWIIEEILSSLIRLSDSRQKADQFRLRDGRSIRTVSALLLQLVQTSTHDVSVEALGICKMRAQAAMRQKESPSDNTGSAFLDETDIEEINLYANGLDSATKAAKTIIVFLTQRSGKAKTTKNSNEAEYRSIFDNLISDLLTVVFWPEWPAASILLSIACKYMVSSLDDIKTSTQSDNNAAKNMALDHLGVIAARLRSSVLKVERSDSSRVGLKPLDEAVSGVDKKGFRALSEAHRQISSHLCKRSSSDQTCASARELTAAIWGQELAFALRQVDDVPDNVARESSLKEFGERLKKALRTVWEEPPSDVFELDMSQEDLLRMDRLAEEIGIIQSLRNSLNPIINVVLLALDAPAVFMRTKALKALGQIVTSDPSILSTANVRISIEGHLLDSSPAVRDAAVELIGKYMIDSPEFAGDYYQKIAERIADTGLAVRKRVIKLLKSFYSVTQDRERRVDICTRLVLRMLDEDETVKDLAIKTIEELWFHDNAAGVSLQKAQVVSPKADLLSKVTVIMGVSSNFKDKQSPLEDLLHQIMSDKNASEKSDLRTRYTEICEALIDGLVDASELPGFTIVNCVRTIHLFTVAHPAVLSAAHANTLLPYLKNATTVEEQITSDYLLRIFRASIPHLPSTAVKFGQELQLALQPMVAKPSQTAGVQGLQETVACMCVIVKYLTHDFSKLVNLLRSCNARLQQNIAKPSTAQPTPVELRGMAILSCIIALLCEHCDFEHLRTSEGPLASELKQITRGPIIEHVFGVLLKLYHKYNDQALRGRILHCLGFLYHAQPALMTAEPSARIMDDIFTAKEEEGLVRLLRIIQEFLVSEAGKHSVKEKVSSSKGPKVSSDVNMEELVGNTDGFADSGVSSAVVQRYLDAILEAALSLNHQVQSPAVDILSFTVKQGLAHPIQLFPVIVALETSPLPSLSARANALHSILHAKHTSLLNARYVASARASFKYQQSLGTQNVHGYRMKPTPMALLQRWYSLVREKRAPRQDFLKTLVRVFDIDISTSSQDDVEFVRYMAENFAMLEYKTQEEVMTVIKYLTNFLSTTGVQILEAFSPSHLLAQLHTPLASIPSDVTTNGLENSIPMVQTPGDIAVSTLVTRLPQERPTRLALMRSSVIVAIIMLLKTHLKALYGLSEDRCSKFVVGKKSALGDKPASKRHEQPILWKRLPFASTPIVTDQDMESQISKFLEIWNEDGLTAEPSDD